MHIDVIHFRQNDYDMEMRNKIFIPFVCVLPNNLFKVLYD